MTTTSDFNLPPVFYIRERVSAQLVPGDYLVLIVKPDSLVIPFTPKPGQAGPPFVGIRAEDLHHFEFSADRATWLQFIAMKGVQP